jgi:hypothetical protein
MTLLLDTSLWIDFTLPTLPTPADLWQQANVCGKSGAPRPLKSGEAS